ncbi:MAG: hypothetical protein ACT4N2_08510 [Hyphomicrobium sp.]
MATARLMIRKGMVVIQGRNRPCIQVQAIVDPKLQVTLTELFSTENLFKRSNYANGLPAGVPIPSPGIAPHVSALLRNDACPEISVKSILAGQLQQCQSVWEMIAFEYIAKRAFDSLLDLLASVSELQTETVYLGANVDLAAFATDTAAELAAVAGALPEAPGVRAA